MNAAHVKKLASDFQPQRHLVTPTVTLALLPRVIVVAVMQKQFVKAP